MNKKIKSIMICSLLSVSLTGCQRIDEIMSLFPTTNNSGSGYVQPITPSNGQQIQQAPAYNQQLVDSIRYATYGMQNSEGETIYDLSFEEIMQHHYTNYRWEMVEENSSYSSIRAINEDGRYVVLRLDHISSQIQPIEVAELNGIYRDAQAQSKFSEYIDAAFAPIKAQLEQQNQQHQQKPNNKNNVVQGTCIYCDGPLQDDDKKSVCKTCLSDPQFGGHMESTAPYGRCASCNAALASDKSNQFGCCDDCFARIKEEDYNEKHKYGDCVDCGVYLSKNEADSYGGRCAECYSRYYGNNNPNMGRCDRCGDSVDLDHTNDGWGYHNLCSGCTGELQMQESMEDYSPYAG